MQNYYNGARRNRTGHNINRLDEEELQRQKWITRLRLGKSIAGYHLVLFQSCPPWLRASDARWASNGSCSGRNRHCEAAQRHLWGRQQLGATWSGVRRGGAVVPVGPQAAAGVETGESGVQRLGWRWISGVRGLGFEERFNNTYNKRV